MKLLKPETPLKSQVTLTKRRVIRQLQSRLQKASAYRTKSRISSRKPRARAKYYHRANAAGRGEFDSRNEVEG